MFYKITIVKIETAKKVERGEYQQIGSRPYTEEDLEDTRDKESYAGKTQAIWGYPPEREIEEEIETEIYTQTVDEMDIKKVLMAINDIDKTHIPE